MMKSEVTEWTKVISQHGSKIDNFISESQVHSMHR